MRSNPRQAGANKLKQRPFAPRGSFYSLDFLLHYWRDSVSPAARVAHGGIACLGQICCLIYPLFLMLQNQS
jgi:hypothetical protein